MREPKLVIGPDLVKLIAEIDEFKGRWEVAQLASITGANRNTLKVRLRELVADGLVRQHGKARAT